MRWPRRAREVALVTAGIVGVLLVLIPALVWRAPGEKKPAGPEQPAPRAATAHEGVGEGEGSQPPATFDAGESRTFSEATQDLLPRSVTVVRALDKITARSRLIELPEDQPVRFGTLEIIARHCESRPPEDEPETAAFLEIWDNREGRREKIFSGWMLASSPALHALEHPVYDLWVTACKTTAPGASGGSR